MWETPDQWWWYWLNLIMILLITVTSIAIPYCFFQFSSLTLIIPFFPCFPVFLSARRSFFLYFMLYSINYCLVSTFPFFFHYFIYSSVCLFLFPPLFLSFSRPSFSLHRDRNWSWSDWRFLLPNYQNLLLITHCHTSLSRVVSFIVIYDSVTCLRH